MTLPIEKGVPLPPLRQERYPFRAMEVGDSFLMPAKPDDIAQTLRNMRAIASNNGRRLNTVYDVRQAVGGVRVWRVG